MNAPPVLMEWGASTLFMVIIFMLIGALWSLWIERLNRMSWRAVYRCSGAIIALTVFLGSLTVRFGVVWFQRYFENRGVMVTWGGSVSWIIFVSTVMAGLGGMCWLRLTLPDLGGIRLWRWATAVAFAVGVLSVII